MIDDVINSCKWTKKQQAGQTWNFKTKVLQRPNDDVTKTTTTTTTTTLQNDDLAVEWLLLQRVMEVNDGGVPGLSLGLDFLTFKGKSLMCPFQQTSFLYVGIEFNWYVNISFSVQGFP